MVVFRDNLVEGLAVDGHDQPVSGGLAGCRELERVYETGPAENMAGLYIVEHGFLMTPGNKLDGDLAFEQDEKLGCHGAFGEYHLVLQDPSGLCDLGYRFKLFVGQVFKNLDLF
jgi:hypothetical protein